jgi:acyl carrier protein
MDDLVWPVLIDEIRETFDEPSLVVEPSTTAEDVEGWDSVSNIELMVALEARFGISFRTGEIASLKNVGELADAIARKTGLPAGV